MPSASGFTAAAAPGGFIRVNGNPLTMDPSDIIKPMAPPPMSPYPGGPGTPTPQLANSHSGSAAGVAAGTGGTCHAHTCSATANRELQVGVSKPWNRNPDLEVLFFSHLMLRFPPILAGV